MADFFVSYTQTDRQWAEWIAWTLEDAGYTATIQAWDFRPGSNFVVEVHRSAEAAERTLAVLSPDYLTSLYATAEWAAAFAQDPDGSRGKLLPVRVREVTLSGLLAAVVAIDLVGLDTGVARETLLAGLGRGRTKPQAVPSFPCVPHPEPSEVSAPFADLPEDEIPAPGPLPAGSRMPLAVNPLFVGREDDLRALARHLKTSGVVAATGLGGVGKTQLACELAHRYGRFFAGGVFWLRFADPAGVPAEIAACGLGLALHPDYARLPLEEQVRLVIAGWQSPVPRLLIFDNCEDESLLDAWRPRSGGARALLTSRRSTWDPALGVAAVALSILPRAASRQLLQRFRPDLPVSDEIDGIAAALGDLPLALHLAGGFLARYAHAPFGQPAVYLASLLKSGLSHPSLGGTTATATALSPTGHESHVGRTFALSFARLAPDDATDAQAIALLARAACLAAGEPIPRDLLLRSLLGESEEDLTALITAEDALSRLTALGLLDLGAAGALVIHRLVAAFAREVTAGTAGDGARTAVEEAILTAAFQRVRSGLPGLLLAVQPHLRALADAALERRDTMAMALSHCLGRHLQQSGDYRTARVYLEKSLALREETLSGESLEVVAGLNNLGHLLQEQGDYAAARPYLERAVAVSTQVLGAEHEDTATCLNNLGILLTRQGDFPAARSAFERVLEIRERILGAEAPATALVLNNLGYLLKDLGDLAGARPALERALAIQEKTLGPDHPETTVSRSNLGILLHGLGDFAGARTHLEQALDAQEKILGPEHPATATGLFNLGSLLESLGDAEAARPLYERALEIAEKSLGPDHPDTARCLNSLGVLLKNRGDLMGASRLLTRALKIREKVLGPDHPETAVSLSNRGSVQEGLGLLGLARASFEGALRIWEKLLGPDHPDLAVTLSNLALLDQRQGDPGAALEHITRALVIRETSLGLDHPETAFCINNLGFILFREGEPDGARPCFERALEVWEATLPPDHPWTAMARRNLEAVGPPKPKKTRQRKKKPAAPAT